MIQFSPQFAAFDTPHISDRLAAVAHMHKVVESSVYDSTTEWDSGPYVRLGVKAVRYEFVEPSIITYQPVVSTAPCRIVAVPPGKCADKFTKKLQLCNKAREQLLQLSEAELHLRPTAYAREQFCNVHACVANGGIQDPKTYQQIYILHGDHFDGEVSIGLLKDYNRAKVVTFCKWLQHFLQLENNDRFSSIIILRPKYKTSGVWHVDDFTVCSANLKVIVTGVDEQSIDDNSSSYHRLSINTILYRTASGYKQLGVETLHLLGSTNAATLIRR